LIKSYAMNWIIGVIVSLIVLSYLSKRFYRKMNPMDTLSYDGILGMKIGDSSDFALSRIKHLKLLNDADVWEQPMIFKYGFNADHITVARGLFNNIEKVGIGFDKNGRIDGFSIDFENYHRDQRETFNSVRYKIEEKIGKPSFVEDGSISWLNGNKCLGIFIDKTNVSAVINRT